MSSQAREPRRVSEMPMQMDAVESEMKQEEDGNVSDDDQMVICEDPQPEIDLKCKDKLTDSDNEAQDDDSDNKNFSQSRYSPVGGQKREGQDAKLDITCRPKPIKGKFRTSINL